MSPIDIVILVLAVAAVVGVVAYAVVRKKQGKSVGCDCSSCNGNCSGCPSKQKQEK